MFGRRRRGADAPRAGEGLAEDGDLDEPGYLDEPGQLDNDAGEQPGGGRPDRAGGPFDLAEVSDPAAGGARVDLGGLWLPGRPGLELRVEADQVTSEVVAVTVVLGESAVQLQPFAAPRSEGIWDDVRTEIRAEITRQGGTVDEVEGPLGRELRTRVPVRSADGSQAVQPARFVGVDGPRWFLRGVVTGRAAVEPATDADLFAVLRDVVVVRGSAPMAPREPIALRLPALGEPADPNEEVDDGPGAGDLRPFDRGPEITEIR